MRIQKEETIVSGESSFDLVFNQLPAMKAHTLLMKTVLPSVGAALKDGGGGDVNAVIGALFQQAGTSQFETIQKELLTTIQFRTDGGLVDFNKAADAMLPGCPDVIFQALAIAFEHNFRPFFNALAGLSQRFPELMGASKSGASSISAGQPND